MKMKRNASTARVLSLCLVAVAVIAVGEMPATANAFVEPFVSHLLAKKMLLKQGLVPQAQGSFYYGGHFQQQPRPTAAYPVYGPPQPPSPTYPPYGPQATSSYVSYVPQPTAGPPSYGPPNVSGYETQPVAKPVQPLPTGCLPSPSYPSQSTDYSNYVVHGGHGFGVYGNYGNNGNSGTYGK